MKSAVHENQIMCPLSGEAAMAPGELEAALEDVMDETEEEERQACKKQRITAALGPKKRAPVQVAMMRRCCRLCHRPWKPSTLTYNCQKSNFDYSLIWDLCKGDRWNTTKWVNRKPPIAKSQRGPVENQCPPQVCIKVST